MKKEHLNLYQQVVALTPEYPDTDSAILGTLEKISKLCGGGSFSQESLLENHHRLAYLCSAPTSSYFLKWGKNGPRVVLKPRFKPGYKRSTKPQDR